MIECTEDIWQLSGSGLTVIAITTNGFVTRNGKAIIGSGVAPWSGPNFGLQYYVQHGE